MALSTVDFDTTFDYTASPKVFSFEDTVDYSGQSVNIANATGVLKVVSPAGVTVYNNTDHSAPDITPSTSRLNTTTIPLPLMGNGSVMQGLYSFTYTVRYTDTTLDEAYDVTATKTVTLKYESPTIDLTIDYSCTTPIISSTDDTNYTVNLVTPTITRDHVLYYPASVNRAAVEGTGSTVSTSTFYYVANQPLQYSSSITSTLSYDLTGGFYVSDEVSGNGYADVTCDASLCSIYCGLKAQYDRWQTYKSDNVRGTEEKNKFNLMLALSELVQVATDCGKTTDAATYLAQIKAIGNITDDCSCGEGTEPQLVVGLGSAGTVTVEAGTAITITEEAGGSSTTYTVSLADAYADKINNAYNSVVAAGTGISVATTTASDGTKTYTVTNTQTQPNTLDSIKSITYAAGSLPVIAAESAITYGTELQDATVEALFDDSVSDWQLQPAMFRVSGFFTGSSSTFTPMVTIIYSVTTAYGVNIFTRPLVAEVINYTSTTFDFRLNDRTIGQAVSGNLVDSVYATMKILIKIVS